MASSAVIIWLHGLGDSGPANKHLKRNFKKPHMNGVKWVLPSAPTQSVTSNHGAYSASWFDVPAHPVNAQTPNFEADVLKAVSSVHAMIDEEVKAGTSPDKIFVCGFSQGGALSFASAMLYPEKLAGVAVIGGWVPLNSDFIENIPAKAKLTNVLWMHGTTDPVIPFSAGQVAPPLLEQAGVHFEFRPYPGLGHYISREQLLYLETWCGIQLQSSSPS